MNICCLVYSLIYQFVIKIQQLCEKKFKQEHDCNKKLKKIHNICMKETLLVLLLRRNNNDMIIFGLYKK